MVSNPKVGDVVRVHYKKQAAPHMPHHGRTGVVRIASSGRPRNHGVDIDGRIIAIPAGNLMKGGA